MLKSLCLTIINIYCVSVNVSETYKTGLNLIIHVFGLGTIVNICAACRVNIENLIADMR